jgi:addiction module HigA family antidote
MARLKLNSNLPLGLETECPPHPGPLFRARFRDASEPPLSREQVAASLELSVDELDEIEQGKRAITADLAVKLAQLTGTDPEMWATLQMRHDLWHALQTYQLLRIGGPNVARSIRRVPRLRYVD